MSPESRSVDNETFVEALAPVVEGMREFTRAVTAVSQGRKLPSADSPGMRELGDDADWATRSGWHAPFADTHSLTELTLRAANDYVRSFADAFGFGRAPIYGHLVLARSALESSVICWWLSEPGPARAERAKRGLSEYIYSAVEEERLDLVPNAAEHVTDFVAYATNLDWPVKGQNGKVWKPGSSKNRGKPRVDGVGRPEIGAGIADLLTNDPTSKLGAVQWSRLSAVSHVTFWGLRSAFDEAGAVSDPISGRASVPVGTDSKSVSLQAVCLLKALRRTAGAWFELMGWRNDEWHAAAAAAEKLERQLLEILKPHLQTIRP